MSKKSNRKKIKEREEQQLKDIQKAEEERETQEQAEQAAAEKAERKKQKAEKRQNEMKRSGGILAAILLSVVFGLTVFLFAPGEMYLANPVEYQLGPRFILLPMLILAVDVMLVLYIVFLVCMLIHPKVFQVVKHLFFGLTLACWVQMTFLNGRMAQFTGDEMVYKSDDPFFIADLIIFCAVTVLPLLVWIILEIVWRKREKKPDLHKLVPGVCAAVGAMQLAAFLPNLFRVMNNDLLTGEPKQVYESYEPLMHYNKENNVVVFLVDRMDSYWLDKTLDYYPVLHDMLDGFTFYQNNVSKYTNTFPSVPEMLSGVEYDGDTFGNYIQRVWSENKLLPKLHDNDYTVNLIMDGPSTYLHLLSLQDVSDNIIGKETGYHVNYLKENGIVPMQAQFAGVKVLPYLLKGLVTNEIESDFANEFVKWDEAQPSEDAHPNAIGVDADVKCLDYLRTKPLAADSEKKVFNYIHLSGAHEASSKLAKYYMYYDDEQRSDKNDKYGTIMGELNAIWEFGRKLKEAGVYDNTTIIILGDHGRAPSLDEEDQRGLDSEIVTGLLVKPAGAPRGALKIDADTPLSNGYFPASVLEYAGIDHSELGLSFNDVVKNPTDAARKLYFYQFMGYYRAPRLLVEYTVKKTARDFAYWKY